MDRLQLKAIRDELDRNEDLPVAKLRGWQLLLHDAALSTLGRDSDVAFACGIHEEVVHRLKVLGPLTGSHPDPSQPASSLELATQFFEHQVVRGWKAMYDGTPSMPEHVRSLMQHRFLIIARSHYSHVPSEHGDLATLVDRPDDLALAILRWALFGHCPSAFLTDDGMALFLERASTSLLRLFLMAIRKVPSVPLSILCSRMLLARCQTLMKLPLLPTSDGWQRKTPPFASRFNDLVSLFLDSKHSSNGSLVGKILPMLDAGVRRDFFRQLEPLTHARHSGKWSLHIVHCVESFLQVIQNRSHHHLPESEALLKSVDVESLFTTLTSAVQDFRGLAGKSIELQHAAVSALRLLLSLLASDPLRQLLASKLWTLILHGLHNVNEPMHLYCSLFMLASLQTCFRGTDQEAAVRPLIQDILISDGLDPNDPTKTFLVGDSLSVHILLSDACDDDFVGILLDSYCRFLERNRHVHSTHSHHHSAEENEAKGPELAIVLIALNMACQRATDKASTARRVLTVLRSHAWERVPGVGHLTQLFEHLPLSVADALPMIESMTSELVKELVVVVEHQRKRLTERARFLVNALPGMFFAMASDFLALIRPVQAMLQRMLSDVNELPVCVAKAMGQVLLRTVRYATFPTIEGSCSGRFIPWFTNGVPHEVRFQSADEGSINVLGGLIKSACAMLTHFDQTQMPYWTLSRRLVKSCLLLGIDCASLLTVESTLQATTEVQQQAWKAVKATLTWMSYDHGKLESQVNFLWRIQIHHVREGSRDRRLPWSLFASMQEMKRLMRAVDNRLTTMTFDQLSSLVVRPWLSPQRPYEVITMAVNGLSDFFSTNVALSVEFLQSHLSDCQRQATLDESLLYPVLLPFIISVPYLYTLKEDEQRAIHTDFPAIISRVYGVDRSIIRDIGRFEQTLHAVIRVYSSESRCEFAIDADPAGAVANMSTLHKFMLLKPRLLEAPSATSLIGRLWREPFSQHDALLTMLPMLQVQVDAQTLLDFCIAYPKGKEGEEQTCVRRATAYQHCCSADDMLKALDNPSINLGKRSCQVAMLELACGLLRKCGSDTRVARKAAAVIVNVALKMGLPGLHESNNMVILATEANDAIMTEELLSALLDPSSPSKATSAVQASMFADLLTAQLRQNKPGMMRLSKVQIDSLLSRFDSKLLRHSLSRYYVQAESMANRLIACASSEDGAAIDWNVATMSACSELVVSPRLWLQRRHNVDFLLKVSTAPTSITIDQQLQRDAQDILMSGCAELDLCSSSGVLTLLTSIANDVGQPMTQRGLALKGLVRHMQRNSFLLSGEAFRQLADLAEQLCLEQALQTDALAMLRTCWWYRLVSAKGTALPSEVSLWSLISIVDAISYRIDVPGLYAVLSKLARLPVKERRWQELRHKCLRSWMDGHRRDTIPLWEQLAVDRDDWQSFVDDMQDNASSQHQYFS